MYLANHMATTQEWGIKKVLEMNLNGAQIESWSRWVKEKTPPGATPVHKENKTRIHIGSPKLDSKRLENNITFKWYGQNLV